MITLLDVIDSAVKIGLGAVIGVIAAKQQHSLELRKDALRRRQDALERIVEDFEAVQRVFVDLYSSFGVHVQFSGKDEAVAAIQGQRVHEIMTTQTIPALQNLHAIEGRLRLFDLTDCASAVNEYRGRVTTFQAAVTLEGPLPSEETIDKKAREFGATRQRFYELLAKAHKGESLAK